MLGEPAAPAVTQPGKFRQGGIGDGAHFPTSGSASEKGAALGIFFVVASFDMCDEFVEPRRQRRGHDGLCLVTEREGANGAGVVQAKKVTGVVIEKGSPGRMPAAGRRVWIEKRAGGGDVLAAHQEPA